MFYWIYGRVSGREDQSQIVPFQEHLYLNDISQISK